MPKITELPSAANANSGDLMVVQKSGVTYQMPISGLPAPASNPFGSLLVPLSSGTGANDSAKFRYFCDNYSSLGRPIIVIPSGTTLDSGANNPFVLPTGFHMMCVPGPTDEFGYQGIINLRHTGSSTTLGTFTFASGSKGQKFTGISFEGTASTRAFVDCPTDASGTVWEYVRFFNVSFDQFESVAQMTGTGWGWEGRTYINNMAASRPPLNINGSDHDLFSNGGFFEMGSVATYSTRAALAAMVLMGNLNCNIGGMYATGSPTTPWKLDGGNSGVHMSATILEGRPSPGTVGGDTPTDGLHCAGALVRVNNGRLSLFPRHYGYAMRDPRPLSGGFQPGGFVDVRGTASVTCVGGSFQPYAAANYPAWTMPNGTAYPVDTVPPLGWVSGPNARATFLGINWGNNCTALPKVYAHNGATVITDGSVQVVTV